MSIGILMNFALKLIILKTKQQYSINYKPELSKKKKLIINKLYATNY